MTWLLIIGGWLLASVLLGLAYAIGASIGYRRAIEDAREAAIERGGERVIYLDELEKLRSGVK